MTSAVRASLIAALASVVVACGGGDGGYSPPPPPPPPPPPGTNVAPVWSSPAAVTVQENATGVAYRPVATDANGDLLTYNATLAGPDAARFTMNAATREVRFISAPDAEAPNDNDTNNTYRLTFTVSDGVAAPVTRDVTITVANVNPGFRVRRIASGLSSPIFVAGLPDGTGRIVVVERGGRIRVMSGADGTASADFLNISGVDTTGEKGLLTIAFSRDYLSDRTFFVHMNPTAENVTSIRRYLAPAAPDVADPASVLPIISITQPSATNHKGGFLAVDAQNFLYIGLGDGGNTPLSSQDPSNLLGKILRLAVNTDAFPADPLRNYAIPPGNGFASGGGAPEVYAMGFRNPFRGSIDLPSGNAFIGDVGEALIEEIDRLPTVSTGVVPNYGWNRREGSQPFNGGTVPPNNVEPVAEYGTGTGLNQGESVTGGVVYRGPIEDLQGQYIFADFVRANIWTAPVANLQGPGTFPSTSFTSRNVAFIPTPAGTGTIDQIAAIGTDQEGNVYFVDLGGEIFRLEPLP
jgi:glucose/arabinose dehydrogenase